MAGFDWERVGEEEWIGYVDGPLDDPAGYCARVERVNGEWGAAVWPDTDHVRDGDGWSSWKIEVKSAQEGKRLCDLAVRALFDWDEARHTKGEPDAG